MHRRLLRYLKWGLWLLLLVSAGVAAANFWVLRQATGRTFTDPLAVPVHSVALVLGTGKTARGSSNPHFDYRVAAAANLYHMGRIRHLLLSGDNGNANYNEPADMREALVAKGVPLNAMTLDFAGFRTLDSLVRAKKVFGITSCIVVSDDFHMARALALADHAGIQAVGFSGTPVPWERSSKSRIREIFARVKMLLDLYVLRTEPKFVGPRQSLPITD